MREGTGKQKPRSPSGNVAYIEVTKRERLVEAGYVEASGTGRGRTYLLSSKFYRAMNNTKAYVRQMDIDRIRHPELVLKLVINCIS